MNYEMRMFRYFYHWFCIFYLSFKLLISGISIEASLFRVDFQCQDGFPVRTCVLATIFVPGSEIYRRLLLWRARTLDRRYRHASEATTSLQFKVFQLCRENHLFGTLELPSMALVIPEIYLHFLWPIMPLAITENQSISWQRYWWIYWLIRSFLSCLLYFAVILCKW